MTALVVSAKGLDDLIRTLKDDGYSVIGPSLTDNAIVLARIDSGSDLPLGWTDVQGPGSYRLEKTGDSSRFSYNVGPTSWKRFLHPPAVELVRIRRRDGTLQFSQSDPETHRMAFIGVRACELAAIAIQDEVFLGSRTVDRTYSARRNDLLIVAVNCGVAGANCFCASMGTGPRCMSGFDLVVTEIIDGDRVEYLIESGSLAGIELLTRLDGRVPQPEDKTNADLAVTKAEKMMGRAMSTSGIRDLLVNQPDHPRWAEVAQRCLTCGNCTMACPTCFCTTTTDAVTLDGEAIRTRKWDSCFSLDFSGLHGHAVRSSSLSRYRQWMTHKLATWHDQFGTSGCVGCGRCITWCPVGIDIREEVAAIGEELLA